MNIKHKKPGRKHQNHINSSKLFTILLPLFFIKCALPYSPYIQGTYFQLTSRRISFYNPHLKTCVFDPQYSIVHFPMYHYPSTGTLSPQDYETVAQSQFQLFHTLIDYSKSSHIQLSVFDENVTKDSYNPQYLRELVAGLRPNDEYIKIDGTRFSLQNLLVKARSLFSVGPPAHYEHLSSEQKDFLVTHGATFILYFLGSIPQIHKVITTQGFTTVIHNIKDSSGQVRLEGNDYWIFNFREMMLRQEVEQFRQYNPLRLCFIIYGAQHDFSDDFTGLPFQSGHFCLQWKINSASPQI